MAIFGSVTAKPLKGVAKELFGALPNGVKIYAYTLTNSKGMSATIINYGATVVRLQVPDRNGKIQDVILGYDDLNAYENGQSYFGGLIGRYANRIEKGQFTLDGKTYQIPVNDQGNALHGGTIGFNKRVWKATILKNARVPSLEMNYISPNGEEGFPGRLDVHVTYSVTDNNELKIQYRATTNKPTVLNLTSHCYFNLSGEPTSSILDETVMINADKFTPTDSLSIPTGQIESVKGTPFDFLKPIDVGARINEDNTQLKYAHGYDDNWVLNGESGKLRQAATVYDPKSGRLMEVLTTEPGIQFYTGNYLNESIVGKGGVRYRYRCALCLETQHYPDSPNHKSFPSTELKPGRVYKQTTIYKFSANQ